MRSGKYKQTNGRLLDYDEEGNNTYCCLGVACDLLEKKGLLEPADWQEHDILPQKERKLLKIDSEGFFAHEPWPVNSDVFWTLVSLNDSSSIGFPGIADAIVRAEKEKNWWKK